MIEWLTAVLIVLVGWAFFAAIYVALSVAIGKRR